MKIAYIITWNLGHNDGVTRKVLRQVREWKKLGHEVEIFCAAEEITKAVNGVTFFKKDRVWSSIFAAFKNRKVYTNLCDQVIKYTPDIVYLRWEFHKRPLARLMENIPTIIEINTFFQGEFRRRSRENWIEKIRYWYYLLTYKKFDKCCSGFVSVCKEYLQLGQYDKWNKPHCYIPNSIPLDKEQKPIDYSAQEISIPRLVFISSGIQPWHGLDNLIELAEKSVGELQFDLITGFDVGYLELPENIKVYPFLEKDEFLEIFKNAVAGIGSAGLYENGMNEACVLKLREYLSAGLPVIVPYKDTAFLNQKSPEWFLELPNEPSSLGNNKEKIMDFVERIRGLRVQTNEVFPYISSEIWEAERVNFFKQVLKMK
jgi:glycosyltransferase involved in cell wall biosynthesis